MSILHDSVKTLFRASGILVELNPEVLTLASSIAEYPKFLPGKPKQDDSSLRKAVP